METNWTHWMAMGKITESAKLAVKNVGGFVRKTDSGPLPIFLVGLPCRVTPGHEEERASDLRITTSTSGEKAIVEIPSAHLKLSWSSRSGIPSLSSIDDTMLDVWQEE